MNKFLIQKQTLFCERFQSIVYTIHLFSALFIYACIHWFVSYGLKCNKSFTFHHHRAFQVTSMELTHTCESEAESCVMWLHCPLSITTRWLLIRCILHVVYGRQHNRDHNITLSFKYICNHLPLIKLYTLRHRV